MARCLLIFAVLLLAGAPVLCQDNRDEIIQKLLLRVEALEREVAALKQGGVVVSPPAVPAAPVTNVVPAVEPAVEPAQPQPSDASRFNLRGYADAGFLRNEDTASSKRFALGEVDLLATERISPKLTALMDVVLETDNQLKSADVPVNVERLLLQYRQNQYFNLDIGSFRTAIGYYSTAFLRGAWLQTALTRPKLFTFEDDGGFLPLHNVGLSANGKIPSGDLGLHYVVEVGSSRNYAQPGRTGLDFADNGAVNIALYARPTEVPGLQLGFSYYHDRFSPLPDFKMTREVWTAHAVYQAGRFEFLNEGVLLKTHEPKQGYGNVPGFYSQLAYRLIPGWNAYFRVDYANVYGKGAIGEYAPQYVPWRTAYTAGVRHELSESVAVKFELGRERDRFKPPWIEAAMQIAFTF